MVQFSAGLRSADDDLQALRALGRTRRMGTAVPSACRPWPIGRDADDRLDARQGAPLGLGRKRGEQKQAIGRSRGVRNTKIHAIADAKDRLLYILLSGGVRYSPAGKFIVVQAPNITQIFYGRDVGYGVERIELPQATEAISATKVRALIGNRLSRPPRRRLRRSTTSPSSIWQLLRRLSCKAAKIFLLKVT